MASEITLYWMSGSPPCWRVMICLEEKGLQGYNSKLLSVSKGEHKSEEVLKLNPRGQMPTFKDGNRIVNESLAIALYLEDKFKSQGTQLIPSDGDLKATTLQRMQESLNIVKNVFEEYMIIIWFNKPEAKDKELMEKKAATARKEVELWEKYVGQTGPTGYIAGDVFTIADACFFPNLALMIRMGLNMESRPNLKAYYDHLSQRKSVQASYPPHWKESEGKDILKDL